MSRRSGAARFLAPVAGVLALALGADQFGLLPGAANDADSAEVGAREEYLARASSAASDAELLARLPELRARAEQARAQWDLLRLQMVSGATPQLAEARFRELVLSALSGLELASPPRVGSVTRDTGGAVRRLGLRIEFDVHESSKVFAAVQKLESVGEARCRVVQLSVEGPGRVQIPEMLKVTMTLESVGLVESGGEGS